MRLEFSRHIFEKYSNIKFQKIRPVTLELFHTKLQTDWRSCRFSKFCERA